MKTSTIAPVMLAAACGREISPAGAKWILDWCAARAHLLDFEPGEDKPGVPGLGPAAGGAAALRDLVRNVSAWAHNNLARGVVMGPKHFDLMESELASGTWLCNATVADDDPRRAILDA